MTRLTIQQFRASLAAPSDPLAHAYRAVTRRPDLAVAMVTAGWIPWSQTTARVANA